MLSPYRVLDLTDERGLPAGQILADLGADVIQVEPPGGSSARATPPFFEGDGDRLTRSAYWAAYARNKRGITCDIRRPEGRDLLRRLVASADFLFESAGAGVMAAWGLGYDELAAVNPGLVYTSITGFGAEGPKAGYADSEIVLWASGGALLLAGDADRAPLRLSVPQAYLHAAGDAADGALVAHFARVRYGRGQQVEISVQQSVAQATLSQVLAASVGQPEARRAAGGVQLGAVYIRTKWPARDGYVELSLGMGTATGHFSNRLMEWMAEEGVVDEATAGIDWRAMPELLASGEVSAEAFDRVQTLVADFLAARSKAELLQAAAQRQLLMTPLATIPELASSPQLAERSFWRTAEDGDGDDDDDSPLRYPGPFVQASNRPIRYRRPAPRLGQHNDEVYREELGLSAEELAQLQQAGVV